VPKMTERTPRNLGVNLRGDEVKNNHKSNRPHWTGGELLYVGGEFGGDVCTSKMKERRNLSERENRGKWLDTSDSKNSLKNKE